MFVMTLTPDVALAPLDPEAPQAGQDRRDDDQDDTPFDPETHTRALARLESIAEQAQDYARHAKAPNTLKAYRNDWDDFRSWCGVHQLEPLPATPQTIALYLTDL